jgi:hypothetical protein
VCEGVVYKDRKKRKDEDNKLELIGGSKVLMMRIAEQIKYFRYNIRKFIKKNKIKDLEKLYAELTEFEKS